MAIQVQQITRTQKSDREFWDVAIRYSGAGLDTILNMSVEDQGSTDVAIHDAIEKLIRWAHTLLQELGKARDRTESRT